MAANQELIQDMNYHKILETIIREGCISRAELAKRLDLTKATISSQVQKLLLEDLVEEIGSSRTTKGRRPIMLRFHGAVAHVLAFDIGPDRINLLLCDLAGEHCYSTQLSWNPQRDDLLPLLYQIIHDILMNPRQENQKLIGICLGIHGVVRENEILFTPYYNLEHAPLKEKLEQRFALPVFIENEANLSALGEKTFSHRAENLVNISIHSASALASSWMAGSIQVQADLPASSDIPLWCRAVVPAPAVTRAVSSSTPPRLPFYENTIS